VTAARVTSTKRSTTAKKVVAKKAAAKAGKMVVLVPAASSTSAYNFYANNSRARSAAVARFYSTSQPSKRKFAK
jgi:hypothetical protein